MVSEIYKDIRLAIRPTRSMAAWAGIDTGLAPGGVVMVFTIIIASSATLSLGFTPLWSIRQISVEQVMRSTGSNISHSRQRINRGDPSIDIDPQGLPDGTAYFSFYNRLLEQLKALPGVTGVSLVRTRPGSGWIHSGRVSIDGIDFGRRP